MKVLQVNCVYQTGSTGKITYDLHSALIDCGNDSLVVYGRGAASTDQFAKKLYPEVYFRLNGLYSRISGIPYGGCLLSTRRLECIIREESPDIVHLQCINGHFVNIYRLISWLNRHRIRTVLTLHAEFMYTANCGYALDCGKWETGCGQCPRYREETYTWLFDRTSASWRKMKRAFDGFDTATVVSVSPWLEERARRSPILGGITNCTVLNGVDTDVFRPGDTAALREKFGLSGEKVIVYVTPSFSSKIKGGQYVLALADQMKGEQVVFILIGNDDRGMKLPENIRNVGRVSDQRELASYYSLADVTLLTSQKETFSMPVAESLCCGTPVAGFRAGGPESIAISAYSEFVDFGDMEALKNAVCRRLQSETDREAVSQAARGKYSKQTMMGNYLALYRKILTM